MLIKRVATNKKVYKAQHKDEDKCRVLLEMLGVICRDMDADSSGAVRMRSKQIADMCEVNNFHLCTPSDVNYECKCGRRLV